MKFVIKLGPVHEKSGLTRYRVAKDLNLSHNTVAKYVDEPEIVVDYITPMVIGMCDYYGVDWRDPAIIEVLEEDETEMESPLLATG